MNIKYILLDPALPVPHFAHPGDAGFDLFAREDTTLNPMEWKAVPSGLKLEIPDGHVGLIWDKSGLSIKNGLKTLGGVVDSGYRGEVMIGMINLSNVPYTFKKGEKVAQMLIQKVEMATFEPATELTDSSRGEAGFGSTGK